MNIPILDTCWKFNIPTKISAITYESCCVFDLVANKHASDRYNRICINS